MWPICSVPFGIEHADGDGGSHPGDAGVLVDRGEHGGVGSLDPRRHVLVGRRARGCRIDGDPAGYFAGGVAAHAVGHGNDDGTRARAVVGWGDGVFVLVTKVADVCRGCPCVLHRTSRMVLPICTLSPLESTVGTVTRRPFT